MSARSDPLIAHVDMDAFFASVELLDDPSLERRPIIVGGLGLRGVVSSASYLARTVGVRSAMPISQARRLCPNAAFVEPRIGRYKEVSAELMSILRGYAPIVEPVSLDEAYLDVSGSPDRADPSAIGAAMRARVRADLGLWCSVGLGPSKLVAKLASTTAKPRARPSAAGGERGEAIGVVHVPGASAASFVASHPIRALPGVGPATAARLHRIGVQGVADLATLPRPTLVTALGDAGLHLQELARGIDNRPVVGDRQRSSISQERTFARDVDDRDQLRAVVRAQCDRLVDGLRERNIGARNLLVKVRFADFSTRTRSTTMRSGSNGGRELAASAIDLLDHLLDTDISGGGVRLVGVSLSSFTDSPFRQLSLDAGQRETADTEASLALEEVLDGIRRRWGPGAIRVGGAVSPAGEGVVSS